LVGANGRLLADHDRQQRAFRVELWDEGYPFARLTIHLHDLVARRDRAAWIRLIPRIQ